MAKQISESKQLTSLDVGATRLTRLGLTHLCKMYQLRALDLWNINIEEPDIDLLAALPELEYLSLGGVEGSNLFNAETLLPRLAVIPKLQRIWLDGVALNHEQKAALETKYEKVRIT